METKPQLTDKILPKHQEQALSMGKVMTDAGAEIIGALTYEDIRKAMHKASFEAEKVKETGLLEIVDPDNDMGDLTLEEEQEVEKLHQGGSTHEGEEAHTEL